MSAAQYDPAAVKTAESDRLRYNVQFISLAILYYDYIVTLPDEIEYIWKNPRRLSTVFYVFCRYALAANLIFLLSIAQDFTGLKCDVGYKVSGVLSILGHAGIIAVWGLRTCAICDKNKIIAAYLGSLGAAILVMLIVRAPLNKCVGQVDLPGFRFGISTTMLIFELSAFLLAAYHAWRTVKDDAKFWANPKSSINYLVFSQGLLYIGPVLLLSLTALSLNFEVPITYSRTVNALKLPLLGFLTARFLIKLRMWERKKNHSDTQTHSLPMFTSAYSQDSSMPEWRRSSISFTTNPGHTNTLDELGSNIGPRNRTEDIEVFKEHNDEEERRLGLSPTSRRGLDEETGADESPEPSPMSLSSVQRGKQPKRDILEVDGVVAQSARSLGGLQNIATSPLTSSITSPSAMRNRAKHPMMGSDRFIHEDIYPVVPT
ncbi:hypothetical protein FA15DRAFT_758706, partial [Coprinopsis marcescibilis]